MANNTNLGAAKAAKNDEFYTQYADGRPWYFSALNPDEQEKFLNTKLLIYVCEGTEKEIKDWFRTINIVGIPLNNQETLNAVYSGPFVTKAKEEFDCRYVLCRLILDGADRDAVSAATFTHGKLSGTRIGEVGVIGLARSVRSGRPIQTPESRTGKRSITGVVVACSRKEQRNAVLLTGKAPSLGFRPGTFTFTVYPFH